MARPTKYRRDLSAIMQADFVRVEGEAPQRWPIPSQTWRRLYRESRIEFYGSPAMLSASEVEAQLRAGFPVLQQERLLDK